LKSFGFFICCLPLSVLACDWARNLTYFRSEGKTGHSASVCEADVGQSTDLQIHVPLIHVPDLPDLAKLTTSERVASRLKAYHTMGLPAFIKCSLGWTATAMTVMKLAAMMHVTLMIEMIVLLSSELSDPVPLRLNMCATHNLPKCRCRESYKGNRMR
jgi:hypothetical protein